MDMQQAMLALHRLDEEEMRRFEALLAKLIGSPAVEGTKLAEELLAGSTHTVFDRRCV